jgi:hypothetical protein
MIETRPTTPTPTPPALPSPALVTRLQGLLGYPSVSVLMSTVPAPRMVADDVARLTALIRDVRRRLAEEDLPTAARELVDPLGGLAVQAATGPTTVAVGLFVSATACELVHLPVPVVDRVVVDPSFATRDLVRALHRTPRHVVLVLGRDQARLFDGLGESLRPAQTRAFPRSASGRGSRRSAGAAGRPRRELDPERRRRFHRDVSQALRAYLRVNPAPVVMIGPERLLAEFQAVAGPPPRLAGTVRGSRLNAPMHQLVSIIRPVLRDYLRSRQDDALALIEQREQTEQLAGGIGAAWLAARSELPELLAVEEGYFYPARLDPSGDLLLPAPDVDHPEVIDDAVDELIEAVLRRGGWVALVEDGALDRHQRVALTVRRG